MKLSVIAFLLLPASAFAQGGPVQQSGPMTPGHTSSWVTNGVIEDGGSALDGKLKEVGITATGTPLCVTDGPRTGPYHQLCFGANALGGGLLSYQAYGGAAPLPFQCLINGKASICGSPSSGVVATAIIGTSPPSGAVPGQLWWDSQGGNLFIWYDDGTSKQWVQTNSPTASSVLPRR